MTAIKESIKSTKFREYDYIVGILRRGAPVATTVALHLNLPMRSAHFDNNVFISEENEDYRLLFVDDVLAQGRTYNAIKTRFPNSDFLVAVWDSHCPIKPDYALFIESEWCWFEWEDAQRVKDGDRGLFRNNTGGY